MSARAGALRNAITVVMMNPIRSGILRFNLLNHSAKAGALRNATTAVMMIVIRSRNLRFNSLNRPHSLWPTVVMARAPRSLVEQYVQQLYKVPLARDSRTSTFKELA